MLKVAFTLKRPDENIGVNSLKGVLTASLRLKNKLFLDKSLVRNSIAQGEGKFAQISVT